MSAQRGGRVLLGVLVFALVCVSAGGRASHAQSVCPLVSDVMFPVDADAFTLVQAFGARSARHDGRYHTGEDWTGPRAQTLGLPVRAAAAGQVVYSQPQGWGRDGGVLMILHTLPGGGSFTTMYGHMVEGDGVRFPAAQACVTAGDVIGVIGDSRPASHIHIEVVEGSASTPSAGYSWAPPETLGLRPPSAFLRAQMARQDTAVRWLAQLNDLRGPVVPPLTWADGSLLAVDGARLVRLLPDGRVLWRAALTDTVAALYTVDGAPTLHFADGSAASLDVMNGAVRARWQTGVAAAGAPLALFSPAGAWLFPLAGGGVAAYRPAGNQVLWRADGVPAFTHGAAGQHALALYGAGGGVTVLSSDGAPLYQGRLQATGAAASAPNGALAAYSRGGLYHIDADGTWRAAPSDAPRGGHSATALAHTPGGIALLFDGAALHAVGADGAVQWCAALPGRHTAPPALTPSDAHIVALAHDGTLSVLRAADGLQCHSLALGNSPNAHTWHRLGTDGVLRVWSGGTVAGLDWTRLTARCSSTASATFERRGDNAIHRG